MLSEEELIITHTFEILTNSSFSDHNITNESHVLALQFADIVKSYALGEPLPEKMLNLYVFNLNNYKWELAEMLNKLFSIEEAVKEDLTKQGIAPTTSWFNRLTEIFFVLFDSYRDIQTELDKLKSHNSVLEARNSELEHKNAVDFLTELLNYESFLEVLQMRFAIRKYKENNSYLGVYMIDLDNFSECNSAFGHEGGDKILQEISKVLRSITRREDEFVARRSGDEFLVLIDNKSIEDIEKFGCLIRDSIAGQPIFIEGELFKATCSVGGVALKVSESVDPKAFIRAADGALYRVKNSGRNDFFFAGEIVGSELATNSNTNQ